MTCPIQIAPDLLAVTLDGHETFGAVTATCIVVVRLHGLKVLVETHRDLVGREDEVVSERREQTASLPQHLTRVCRKVGCDGRRLEHVRLLELSNQIPSDS